MWTDESFLITSDIDDDDSATSKACELVQTMFSVECNTKIKKGLSYIGQVEHNDALYSIISFEIPRNQMPNFNKRPRVRFDYLTKEFQIIESPFRINDSFALAVGLKFLSAL